MPDDLFMKEAMHRAVLLTDRLNPGKSYRVVSGKR